MARSLRIEFKGAWYLIHNRGIEGINIFNDDEDRREFLNLLKEVSQLFSIQVHAYCLLEDEVFLVLHTPEAQLARAMRHLNGVYTQHHNKVWEHNGAVFQGRYKSLIFDAKDHLLDLVSYVHHIPVMNGETHSADRFQWSSHRAYLNERNCPSWLCTKPAIDQLGGFLKSLSLVKFNRMVQKGPSLEFMSLLEDSRQVLGSEDFFDQVGEDWSSSKTTKSQSSKAYTETAKEILSFVAKHYGTTAGNIKSSQAGVQNEARSMAVYQLRQAAGLPQKEIARVLNSKNGYTVAKVFQRFNEKLQKDDDLQKQAQELTQAIQDHLTSEK